MAGDNGRGNRMEPRGESINPTGRSRGAPRQNDYNVLTGGYRSRGELRSRREISDLRCLLRHLHNGRYSLPA